MATREAPQKHAVLLEMQQVLVAVKAAEYFSNSVQHSSRQPIELGALIRRQEDLVKCHKPPRDATDHGFDSFTMYNAAARDVERGGADLHEQLKPSESF